MLRYRMCTAGWLLCASSLLAGTPAPDEFSIKTAEAGRRYKAQDWPGTLTVLEEMLRLVSADVEPERRAAVLYDKARVHARAGELSKSLACIRAAISAGRTDYLRYAEESDFASLRETADFKTILIELKARYGPHALQWDKEPSQCDFSMKFDETDTPELETLRKEFSTDAVVQGARDDYERLRRLTVWVSRQWEHSSTQSASKSDPLTILREARKGGRFICLNYAIVLAGVANAYGLKSRVVGMMPAGVETRNEAHSAVEVWIPQFRKWALADGQWGVIAERGGIPLNAVELQDAIARETQINCVPSDAPCAQWKRFVFPNLYYFKIADDQRSYRAHISRQLVLIPKGSKIPRKFAGGSEWIFKDAVYVSDPATFYPPLE